RRAHRGASLALGDGSPPRADARRLERRPVRGLHPDGAGAEREPRVWQRRGGGGGGPRRGWGGGARGGAAAARRARATGASVGAGRVQILPGSGVGWRMDGCGSLPSRPRIRELLVTVPIRARILGALALLASAPACSPACNGPAEALAALAQHATGEW